MRHTPAVSDTCQDGNVSAAPHPAARPTYKESPVARCTSLFLQMSLFCRTVSFSPSPSQRLGPDQTLSSLRFHRSRHQCACHQNLRRATVRALQSSKFFANSVNVLRTATGSVASQAHRLQSSSLHPPRQPRTNGPATKKAGSASAQRRS